MKLLSFFQPNNIDEAKVLLSKYENSKLLAGGTDLLLDFKKDMNVPQYLIDLSKILELKSIVENESDITIGSMVTFTQVKGNKLIKDNFNSIILCAKSMGSPQIRNVATIGGNIINGAVAADIVPCVISLDGILVFESIDTLREVRCEDYFRNNSIEKIKGNEILTKIIIPKRPWLSGYYKLGKRNSLAIARANTALSLSIEENIIKDLRVCLGAVGKFPFRVNELESRAVGKIVEWLFDDEALNILENTVYESIKERKTMPFKRNAIKGVFKNALLSAVESGGNK